MSVATVHVSVVGCGGSGGLPTIVQVIHKLLLLEELYGMSRQSFVGLCLEVGSLCCAWRVVSP